MARVCTDPIVSVSSVGNNAYGAMTQSMQKSLETSRWSTSRLVAIPTHHMGESAVQSRHWTVGLEGCAKGWVEEKNPGRQRP
jgi:hypothetical protein